MVAASEDINRPMPTAGEQEQTAARRRASAASRRTECGTRAAPTSRTQVACTRPISIDGSALPIMISHRRQRRHQQLIEGALLALARHRQRRQQQGLQQRQRPDQRRASCSSASRGWGCTRRASPASSAAPGSACALRQSALKLHRRCADIAERRAGGVRVAAVDDHLHRRRLAPASRPASKSRSDLHAPAAPVARRSTAAISRGAMQRRRRARTDAGAVEARQQLRASVGLRFWSSTA